MRPNNANTITTTSTVPSNPLGRYPQLRLCGHAGITASNSTINKRISNTVSLLSALRQMPLSEFHQLPWHVARHSLQESALGDRRAYKGGGSGWRNLASGCLMPNRCRVRSSEVAYDTKRKDCIRCQAVSEQSWQRKKGRGIQQERRGLLAKRPGERHLLYSKRQGQAHGRFRQRQGSGYRYFGCQ